MENRKRSKRRAPRLAEVAKLAGVSPSLVSRIINNDPTLRVRSETRDQVLAAVKMLNYTPHISARALRSAQTGLLGFVLHHVNDPIYAEMVDSAQVEAAKRGYPIILINTAELADRGDQFRDIVLGRKVDGLLVHSGFGRGTEELQEIARSVPSVMFGSDPMAEMRTIRLDDETAARVATQYLIDAGHTHIAFVGADGSSSARRYAGYLAVMQDAGLPALPPVNGGWTSDEARDATVAFLRSKMRVTGMVVVTTTTALGVHSGVVSAGLRIPDDVSVISIHDAWFARHLNPPLTVVSLPLGEIGKLAVEMLIEQVHSPTVGELVVTEPPPQLIVRGSTSERSGSG